MTGRSLVLLAVVCVASACRSAGPVHPSDDPKQRAKAWQTVQLCPETRDLPSALARLACFDQVREVLFKDPAYQRQMAGLSRHAGELLAHRAGQADVSELPGARYYLEHGAHCLAPQVIDAARPAQSRAELIHAVAPTFRMVTRAPGQPSLAAGMDHLCSQLASQAGDAIVCSSGSTEHDIELELALGATSHSVEHSEKAVRYEVRRDISPNPGYQVAFERLHLAERQADQAEVDYVASQRACDEAEAARSAAGYCYDCPEYVDEERECDTADRLEDIHERRQDELDEAKRRLDDTDEVIETPIYDMGYYAVRSHVWQTPATLRVIYNGQLVYNQTLTLSVGDIDHDGFGPAGVGPDPLDVPGPEFFASELRSQASSQAAALVVAELDRRARARDPACRQAAPWSAEDLQCRGELSLLRRQPLGPGHVGVATCS